MRPNCLYPPFDNPAIRRAIMGAIDQTAFMTAAISQSIRMACANRVLPTSVADGERCGARSADRPSQRLRTVPGVPRRPLQRGNAQDRVSRNGHRRRAPADRRCSLGVFRRRAAGPPPPRRPPRGRPRLSAAGQPATELSGGEAQRIKLATELQRPSAAITDSYSWRWVFFVNLPFGILTTAGLWVFMSETPTRRDVPFSWFGFLSLSLGIGSLQMMLDRGEQLGWFEFA